MLTRSGVVSSVHAFAQSSIGSWFVGFLIIIFVVCFAAYWKNRDYLRSDNQLDSLVSRESSFLFNNLILLAACFAVLWGTLFPVLSEWVDGSKISVGPPFFNKVNIPIALFLLLLTGVGPLLAWRKTSFDALRRNFAWPLAGGMLAGVIGFIFGFRDILLADLPDPRRVRDAHDRLRIFPRRPRDLRPRRHELSVTSMGELTMRNTRRYGGYVIHFGMVLVFIGIAGTPSIRDVQKEMAVGDSLRIGPYTILCQNFDHARQRQLPIRPRHPGSFPERQVGHDAVSRAPLFPCQPGDRNHGRDSVHRRCAISMSSTPAAAPKAASP